MPAQGSEEVSVTAAFAEFRIFPSVLAFSITLAYAQSRWSGPEVAAD
jgi:hypothetical protein